MRLEGRCTVPGLRRSLAAAPRKLLRAAEAAAADLGAPLWLVGGAVRDLAIGRPVHDLDLAVDGDVDEFARRCAARLPAAAGAVEVRTRHRFGTATVHADGVRLDVARLRTERYQRPGALPSVEATHEIERDLARRDFTVNAMALGLAGPRRGELIDPFRGLEDLAVRRLRVLHDRSFEDDATRLWRGARTAALVKLRPDEHTARLIENGVRWLNTISGDRLWTELVFTARRGRAGATLERLDLWGVLPGIHPALRYHESSRSALRHRPRPLPPGRLGAVLIAPLDDPRGILDRFTVDRATRETVLAARRLLDAAPCADPETLEQLSGAPGEARIAARWLHPGQQEPFQLALRRWERTRPPLDAAALRRLGVPRDAETGRALGSLRRARFLGSLDSAAAARRAVRETLEAGPPYDWRFDQQKQKR